MGLNGPIQKSYIYIYFTLLIYMIVLGSDHVGPIIIIIIIIIIISPRVSLPFLRNHIIFLGGKKGQIGGNSLHCL